MSSESYPLGLDADPTSQRSTTTIPICERTRTRSLRVGPLRGIVIAHVLQMRLLGPQSADRRDLRREKGHQRIHQKGPLIRLPYVQGSMLL